MDSLLLWRIVAQDVLVILWLFSCAMAGRDLGRWLAWRVGIRPRRRRAVR